MKVQCKICGHIQEFSSIYPYCTNCGAILKTTSESKIKISRKGKNIQGIAILLFLFCIGLFLFLSRFFGTIGAILCIIMWGIGKFVEKKEKFK
jgi:ribosomal protein S27E